MFFQMPSVGYGLSLEFEAYELTRASFQQPCTQGQWLVENRRYTHPLKGADGRRQGGRKQDGEKGVRDGRFGAIVKIA